MTNFVASVVQNLRIDSNNDPSPVSRVGVVTYGITAQIQFQLDAYDSMAKLLQAINVPFAADPQANLAQAIRFVSINTAHYLITSFICLKLFINFRLIIGKMTFIKA